MKKPVCDPAFCGLEGRDQSVERGFNTRPRAGDLAVDHVLVRTASHLCMGAHRIFDQFRADKVRAHAAQKAGVVENLAGRSIKQICCGFGLVAQWIREPGGCPTHGRGAVVRG